MKPINKEYHLHLHNCQGLPTKYWSKQLLPVKKNKLGFLKMLDNGRPDKMIITKHITSKNKDKNMYEY